MITFIYFSTKYASSFSPKGFIPLAVGFNPVPHEWGAEELQHVVDHYRI